LVLCCFQRSRLWLLWAVKRKSHRVLEPTLRHRGWVLTLHFWNLVRDHISYFVDNVLTCYFNFDTWKRLHYPLTHLLLFFQI
jgi:hypothetical protein